MNERRPLRPTARHLLALLLCCSCRADHPPGTCEHDSDCADDELCNLLVGTCVPNLERVVAPEGMLAGSFTCRVAENIASTTVEGTSTVVGRFQGELLRLDTVAFCYLRDSTDGEPTMEVRLHGRRGVAGGGIEELSLSVELPPSVLDGTRAFSIGRGSGAAFAELSAVPIVGGTPQTDDLQFLAVGQDGDLEIDGDVEPGAMLSGTLSISITPLGSVAFGEPCASDDECDQLLICPIGACTTTCASDEECPGGGVCVTSTGLSSGFCHPECSDPADCATGQRCLDPAMGREVCAPDGLYVLPTDPNALGAPCEDATDCEPLGACVTFGEVGVCSSLCEEDEDCAWFVGIETTCVQTDTAALCAPSCLTDADCPEGLICTPEEICVPPEAVSVTEVDLDTYLETWTELACDYLAGCFGAAWAEWNYFGTGCEGLLRTGTADGEAQIRAEVAAGRVVYDGVETARCFERWASGDCTEPNAGREYICDNFIGQRAAGETCSNDDQCGVVASYCAFDGTCPGVCRAKAALDDACSDEVPCADGLVCHEQLCVRPGGVAAGCGIGEVPCRFGLVCVGETASALGTCRSSATLFASRAGEACDPDVGPFCREGLACVLAQTSPSVTWQCRARVAAGAPCRLAYLSQCPPTQQCTATGASPDGTCVALPSQGQACSTAVGSLTCAPGLGCDETGTCVAGGELGDACSIDGECWSGTCAGGACAATNGCAL
jgi:hypothetical protein